MLAILSSDADVLSAELGRLGANPLLTAVHKLRAAVQSAYVVGTPRSGDWEPPNLKREDDFDFSSKSESAECFTWQWPTMAASDSGSMSNEYR